MSSLGLGDLGPAFLLDTPLLLAFLGILVAFFFSALLTLLLYAILLAAWDEFRTTQFGGASGKEYHNTATVLLVTFPGLNTFVGDSLVLIKTSVTDLINAVSQLFSADALRLAALVALGIGAGYAITNDAAVKQQFVVFQTCTMNDLLDWGKEVRARSACSPDCCRRR